MKNITMFLGLGLGLLACGQESPNLEVTPSGVIIGKDNRSQVTSIKQTHLYSVGWLKSQAMTQDTYSSCTATIIGKNLLATAAHCVLDDNRIIHPNITFTPSHLGSHLSSPLKYHVEKVWIHKAYFDGTKKGDIIGDIAILQTSHLKDLTPVHQAFTSAKIYPWDSQNMAYKFNTSEYQYHVYGYSGDKESGTLWQDTCKAKVNSRDYFIHYCDTTTGNSGGPIFIHHKKSNKYQLVGVHTSSLTNEKTGIKRNTGALITEDIFRIIQKISRGQDDQVKSFKLFKTKVKPFRKVYVSNKCPKAKDVYFAIRYQDAETGKWSNHGYYIIKSGENTYIADTKENHLYFWAESKKGPEIWEGKDNAHVIHGDKVQMIKIGASKKKLNYSINLTCK
jgi:V8-like Glu-specific endopeptidase